MPKVKLTDLEKLTRYLDKHYPGSRITESQSNQANRVFRFIEETEGSVIKHENSKRLVAKFISLGLEGYYLERLLRANRCGTAVTLKKFVSLYGKVEGLNHWNEYKNKQAKSNSFEYKKEKYGMTESEFYEYNKNRSVTLENCIRRHGKDKGSKIYKEYVEKQKVNGVALEYFQKKYGEEEGLDKYLKLNKLKSHSLENYLKRYGEEGYDKYIEFFRNRGNTSRSRKADDFFDDLVERIKGFNLGKIYYKTEEFGKLDKENSRYYFYDFVIPELKFCVEYNGNWWHLNPEIYSEEYIQKTQGKVRSAKEVWEFDEIKNNTLRREGYDVIIVWEKSADENYEEVMNYVVKEISSRSSRS